MVKKIVRKVFNYSGYESILWHRAVVPLPRIKPTFFVVGAQKGGTSALFKFLTSFPDIASAYKKELFFFDQSFDRGLKYYRNFFPISRPNEIRKVGDFSPSYFPNEVAPMHLSKTFPDAKLVFMLRPPLERLLSHYAMSKGNGWEDLTLADALEKEQERITNAKQQGQREGFEVVNRFGYQEHSLYGKHLARWLEHFPIHQFLFVDNQSLSSSPVCEIQRVREFIGLDDAKLDEEDPFWKKRVFSGGTRKESFESIPISVQNLIKDDLVRFEELRKT